MYKNLAAMAVALSAPVREIPACAHARRVPQARTTRSAP